MVIMTTMPQCCKLCGAYQDKVYSISGKDKRFPALFKTVLKSGYALPHPNCRHEFIPYFAEAEDPADLERMIKQSRIKYDSKGRLADVRTQTDIELYQAWQAGNRQRNTEYLEYEEMKKHYAGRESEMPYKTLAAFRTARRRDELSPAYKAWRYRKQDARQYERWAQILGKENMPKDVDSFQEIKYNKHKQAEFQFFQHYKYARESGDISALVDFNLYTKTKKTMQHKFVGQIAVNGTKISSISNHFLDRHFGTIYRKSKKDPKHEGVMIEEIESAIKNGIVCDIKTDAKGRKSQKIYIKGKVDITVNPDTGELIQCNKISK
ncbi:MAG: hypothetical protein IJF39_05820 [Clostridia bacterium]|nr:hypothetical protein [Clostridia bacterium]